MYEHLNVKNRLVGPVGKDSRSMTWQDAARQFAGTLAGARNAEKGVALILSPQYSNEEYRLVIEHVEKSIGVLPEVFVWREETENRDSFDGLLFRGDRNPNSAGLAAVLKEKGLEKAKECRGLKDLGPEFSPALCIVMGPEIEVAYPSLNADLSVLAELPHVVYFGNTLNKQADAFALRVPTLCFTEKDGVWVNHSGQAQELSASQRVLPSVRSLSEFFAG